MNFGFFRPRRIMAGFLLALVVMSRDADVDGKVNATAPPQPIVEKELDLDETFDIEWGRPVEHWRFQEFVKL